LKNENANDEKLNLREQLFDAASQLVSSIDRKILLVEDTAAHAALIRRTINLQEWDLEHVTSGQDALTSYRESPGRVVLLDLTLPDLDGVSVMQSMFQINKNARIVIITSADNVSTSVNAMKLGAVDYVVKSDYDELQGKIAKAIDTAWLGAIEIAEKELISKTKVLELVKSERLNAIETLVRTVCHEVNNPLSGVVAISQLLLQKNINEDANRLATQIITSAGKVTEVIDKLRVVSDEVVEFGGQEIFSLEKEDK